MTTDNNRSMTSSVTSSSSSEPSASAPKKRLEDLLIEDDSPKTTFRDLADQEVKSGKRVDSSLRWPFVILALLIFAMVGVVIGWYQFGDLLTGQPKAQDLVRVEKRMLAPERPQLLTDAQQNSGNAARQVVTGDGSAATEIAEPAITEAADLVTEDLDEETAVTLSGLAVPPAVVPRAIEGNESESVLIAAEAVISEEQQVATKSLATVAVEPVHRVIVGPFISQGDLERARALLRERGYQPEQEHGAGTVDMIRLLEGIYPLGQAQQRLEEVRKEFSSTFLLPDGDRWALYIGSFSDRERARRQQRELAARQIPVAQVDSQLTMEGPLLVVVRSGLQAAEEVAAEVNASGLRARIEVER